MKMAQNKAFFAPIRRQCVLAQLRVLLAELVQLHVAHPPDLLCHLLAPCRPPKDLGLPCVVCDLR